MKSRLWVHHGVASILCGAIILLTACQGDPVLSDIDRRVEEMLTEMQTDIGAEAPAPQATPGESTPRSEDRQTSRNRITDEKPPTVNPLADSLVFTPALEDEADQVIARLEGYGRQPDDALVLDLDATLQYAQRNSREYRFAEEEYVLSGLRLLIERHRWGPRFFDEVSATVSGDGDSGLFDTSLNLVNEFRVTQRLPYGGEVSARALARATEDLYQRVSGEPSQTAELIFSADIPLLRGAGTVAREDRIQAERNLVYAAREFERFRREYLVDITREYMNLIVSQRGIVNAEKSVESFEQLQDRAVALHVAGRRTLFDRARAEQDTVQARERLIRARENYRLAVDRFKVRLGIPIEQPVQFLPTNMELTPPAVSMDDVVRQGLAYRLDLQTRRDQVDDSRRAVNNAGNNLLPDLDLTGNVSIPTDSEKTRGGLGFEPGDASFNAGVTFGLPLDREIERISLREAQILLQRTQRNYDQFRDEIVLEIRRAAREIDRARFSLEIQENNVKIAERRVESINADPDRATVQDLSDAINGLLNAKDSRDQAKRDLQIAILEYLLASGQLRTELDGTIRLIPGMNMMQTVPESTESSGSATESP